VSNRNIDSIGNSFNTWVPRYKMALLLFWCLYTYASLFLKNSFILSNSIPICSSSIPLWFEWDISMTIRQGWWITIVELFPNISAFLHAVHRGKCNAVFSCQENRSHFCVSARKVHSLPILRSWKPNCENFRKTLLHLIAKNPQNSTLLLSLLPSLASVCAISVKSSNSWSPLL